MSPMGGKNNNNCSITGADDMSLEIAEKSVMSMLESPRIRKKIINSAVTMAWPTVRQMPPSLSSEIFPI